MAEDFRDKIDRLASDPVLAAHVDPVTLLKEYRSTFAKPGDIKSATLDAHFADGASITFDGSTLTKVGTDGKPHVQEHVAPAAALQQLQLFEKNEKSPLETSDEHVIYKNGTDFKEGREAGVDEQVYEGMQDGRHVSAQMQKPTDGKGKYDFTEQGESESDRHTVQYSPNQHGTYNVGVYPDIHKPKPSGPVA